MTNILKNQPVIAAALAELSALTGILVAFGVRLTESQTAAISGLGVATLALTVVVWKLVTPVAYPRTLVKVRADLVPAVTEAAAPVPPNPTPEAPNGV